MTTIELDDYERDNLLALLHVIIRGDGKAVSPLACLNTGDWIGQIYGKLAERGFDPSVHNPNHPIAMQLDDLSRRP